MIPAVLSGVINGLSKAEKINQVKDVITSNKKDEGQTAELNTASEKKDFIKEKIEKDKKGNVKGEFKENNSGLKKNKEQDIQDAEIIEEKGVRETPVTISTGLIENNSNDSVVIPEVEDSMAPGVINGLQGDINNIKNELQEVKNLQTAELNAAQGTATKIQGELKRQDPLIRSWREHGDKMEQLLFHNQDKSKNRVSVSGNGEKESKDVYSRGGGVQNKEVDNNIGTALMFLAGFVTQLYGNVKEYVSEKLDSVNEWVDEKFTTMNEWFVGTKNEDGEYENGLLSTPINAINDAADWVDNKYNTTKAIIKDEYEHTKAFYKEKYDDVKGFFGFDRDIQEKDLKKMAGTRKSDLGDENFSVTSQNGKYYKKDENGNDVEVTDKEEIENIAKKITILKREMEEDRIFNAGTDFEKYLRRDSDGVFHLTDEFKDELLKEGDPEKIKLAYGKLARMFKNSGYKFGDFGILDTMYQSARKKIEKEDIEALKGINLEKVSEIAGKLNLSGDHKGFLNIAMNEGYGDEMLEAIKSGADSRELAQLMAGWRKIKAAEAAEQEKITLGQIIANEDTLASINELEKLENAKSEAIKNIIKGSNNKAQDATGVSKVNVPSPTKNIDTSIKPLILPPPQIPTIPSGSGGSGISGHDTNKTRGKVSKVSAAGNSMNINSNSGNDGGDNGVSGLDDTNWELIKNSTYPKVEHKNERHEYNTFISNSQAISESDPISLFTMSDSDEDFQIRLLS